MQGILIVLMVTASLTSIGCGKKKKPSQQAMINACLFDPTGNCPRQAAAMAQAGAPGQLPLIQAIGQNPNLLTGGGVSTGAGVRVASATPTTSADLARQRIKVQSALAADAANPRSMHYDPPQSSVPQQSRADVDAARGLPTQNEQVGLRNGGSRAPAAVEEAGIR